MTVSSTDFQYISTLLRAESAIVLDAGKEYLVEARLGPIARELGLGTIEDLIAMLRKSPTLVLKKKVVDALTTNETSFFRDIDPFEVLKTLCLPPLIKARQSTKKLTIWSAASSTGQEAYTIAMTLRDHFRELDSWQVNIMGTDLCSEVVQRARSGTYTQLEINRGLPAMMLVKHFEKAGTAWTIKDPIRKMVKFDELNLVKPWGPKVPQCDIVFLRNVLIYFDAETKTQILKQVRQVLRPDGFLFLGAAETTLNLDGSFQRAGAGKGGCYIVKP